MHSMCRALATLLAAAICALPVVNADASDGGDKDPRERRVLRGATLTIAQSEVDEGDRVSLKATIRAPRRATTITLQKRYQHSEFMEPTWLKVASQRVRSRSRVGFRDVATTENAEVYRVVVAYRGARRFTSRPDSVVVWRWVPLSDYSPYYTTGSSGFGRVSINGRSYDGWGPYASSHASSHESRFTPGRNCTTLRGVFGVSDISGDGSSGTVVVTADDVTVWESPLLTPGTEVIASVPLNRSYRMGLRLTDTTPGATSGRDAVESWPVVGEPALRCTGV